MATSVEEAGIVTGGRPPGAEEPGEQDAARTTPDDARGSRPPGDARRGPRVPDDAARGSPGAASGSARRRRVGAGRSGTALRWQLLFVALVVAAVVGLVVGVLVDASRGA